MLDETLLVVMDELARRGVGQVVTLEYPGFLKIERPEGRGVLAFGTANRTWGCDVYDDVVMEHCIESIESSIPSDSRDAVRIADYVIFVAISAGVEFPGGGDVPFVEVRHHGA